MADKQLKDVFNLISKYIVELEKQNKKFTSLQSSDIPIIKDTVFQNFLEPLINNHKKSQSSLSSLKFLMKNIPELKSPIRVNKKSGVKKRSIGLNITNNIKETKAQEKNKLIGITTDLAERKAHWKKIYPNMKNFKISNSGLTHAHAQAIENKYLRFGYSGHPGGPAVPGYVYSVYTFDKS